MVNLENIAFYDADPICFLFLGSAYHTSSVTLPLCCFTLSPGQLGMVDGSWHWASSQHPNRISAERLWALKSKKLLHLCSIFPQIKIYFLTIITSSGSWSDVFWTQWKNYHCFQWLLKTYHLAILSRGLLLSPLLGICFVLFFTPAEWKY